MNTNTTQTCSSFPLDDQLDFSRQLAMLHSTSLPGRPIDCPVNRTARLTIPLDVAFDYPERTRAEFTAALTPDELGALARASIARRQQA